MSEVTVFRHGSRTFVIPKGCKLGDPLGIWLQGENGGKAFIIFYCKNCPHENCEHFGKELNSFHLSH